jgi:hypothetical protein
MLTDDDKQWISQHLERVETKLLAEFHKSAGPLEMRQPALQAALRAFNAELKSIADRLKRIER